MFPWLSYTILSSTDEIVIGAGVVHKARHTYSHDVPMIHGCIFCYWMCRSDVLVIPIGMSLSFFLDHSFGLSVKDF